MSADRVFVPRLLSRSVSMWLSVAAAALSIPAVLVWAFVTQPAGNQVAGVVFCVVILAVLGALVLRRTWLDVERGLLVRELLGVVRRPAAWVDASVVRVRSNRGGQALLEVRASGRRTSTYIPLVAVDLGGDRSQSPEFLGVLADQIEHWSPQRVALVNALRAQAGHLAAGGSVRDSPLARAHLARR